MKFESIQHFATRIETSNIKFKTKSNSILNATLPLLTAVMQNEGKLSTCWYYIRHAHRKLKNKLRKREEKYFVFLSVAMIASLGEVFGGNFIDAPNKQISVALIDWMGTHMGVGRESHVQLKRVESEKSNTHKTLFPSSNFLYPFPDTQIAPHTCTIRQSAKDSHFCAYTHMCEMSTTIN